MKNYFRKNGSEILPWYDDDSSAIAICKDELPKSYIMSIREEPEIQNDEDKQLYIFYRDLHNANHWSVDKTVTRLKSLGKPVKKDLIEEAWLKCPYCQPLKKVAPLSKLKFRETPELPFDEVHIDHIIKNKERKSSHGHRAGFTLKCALTRYFTCFPVKDVQIRTVVERLQDTFQSTGKIPRKIYADNAFDTTTMRNFCEQHKIDIAFRASNLSRSVSVEATHRRFHEKVDSFLGDRKQSQWHEVAWQAAMALNGQPHESIGFSPYFLFLGKQPAFSGSREVPTHAIQDDVWTTCLPVSYTHLRAHET